MSEPSVSVYTILNRHTGRVYVGCTTRNPRIRFQEHSTRGTSDYPLRQDMLRLGRGSFILNTVWTGGASDGARKERELIDRFSKSPCGSYNHRLGGEGVHVKTAEQRKLIAEAGRGRKPTQLQIETAGARYRGKKLSPEHVAKLSESHKGNRPSDETRAKMSPAHKARGPRTAQHSANLSASLTRYYEDPAARERASAVQREVSSRPEVRQKRSAAMKGRKFSPDHRAKLVAAAARRWAKPEERAKQADRTKAYRSNHGRT